MSISIQPDNDSVAIVSGGMDSVTLLYYMHERGRRPVVLSFDYGQRHKKELYFAKYHAHKLNLTHHVIDLSGITGLISNSALTSPEMRHSLNNVQLAGRDELAMVKRDIEVPEGHYSDENMKLTVVPNRNMMMLSIAAAVAVNNHAYELGIGVHGGDHAIYPDCRPEFIIMFEQTLKLANAGFINPEFQVFAPFLTVLKEDIAKMGAGLGINWSLTWSCYKGGDFHCGRCATCVERREAFHNAEVEDTTDYEDKTNYYLEVTQNA